MKFALSIIYLISFIVFMKLTDLGNYHISIGIIGGLVILFLLGYSFYQMDLLIKKRRSNWYRSYQSRLETERNYLEIEREKYISKLDPTSLNINQNGYRNQIAKLSKKIDRINKNLD